MLKANWKNLAGAALAIGAIAAVWKIVNPKCRWCDTALKIANAVQLVCPTCRATFPRV
jgi:tRNA(Ile2) C34 agmatinyltransferase TiaS